jgi:hypothetical protein
MEITIMADEERYNNRMLDDRFDRQTKDLKEHMELVTKPILDQVLKTNGRVNTLEGRMNQHEGWHERRDGASRIISMIAIPLFTLLIGYLGWLSARVLAVPTEIRTAVDGAFNQNLEVNN